MFSKSYDGLSTARGYSPAAPPLLYQSPVNLASGGLAAIAASSATADYRPPNIPMDYEANLRRASNASGYVGMGPYSPLSVLAGMFH